MAVLETHEGLLDDLFGYVKLQEILAKIIAFINSQAGALDRVQESVALMQGRMDHIQTTATQVASQSEKSGARLESQVELVKTQFRRIDEQEVSIAKLQDAVSLLQSHSVSALELQAKVDEVSEQSVSLDASVRKLTKACDQHDQFGRDFGVLRGEMDGLTANHRSLQKDVETRFACMATVELMERSCTELRMLIEAVPYRSPVAPPSEFASGTAPPMADPESDDEMPVALRKMFPARPQQDLEMAAQWLNDSFGVSSYCDIGGAGSWAEAGMALVDGDGSLSEGGKQVLRDLLTKQALGDHQPASLQEPPPTARSASKSSSTIAPSRRDDFLVTARLGEGSFAVVHKVVETAVSARESPQFASRRNFALKEINLSRLRSEALRSQAEQEASIHPGLNHPHVLRCFETFEIGTTLFLLLELAEGGVFWKFMRARKVLKEAEAARFYSEVAQGVHYLHLVGVMHRDLKPENILLDAQQHAKIADFGWSCRVASNLTTECGTPAYLAPEMVAKESYNKQVDVWALGILLYEMLVGYSPFSSALTESEIRRRIVKMDFGYGAWFNVPAAAQPLIRNLLQRNPDDRPKVLDTMEEEWLTAQVGTSALAAARTLEHEYASSEG